MLRRSRGQRTGEPASLLVVGLGNPGSSYVGTRHNVGVEVVALLAGRHGVSLRKSKQLALACELRIAGELLAMACPQTYMNESGQSVVLLLHRYGIDDPARLVVIHDELDLPVGTIRVKEGGGLAGHNGLRSVADHLGTQDFLRIRIGVGKPPGRQKGADYVLRRPPKEEAEEIAVTVGQAADAVEVVLAEGVEAAMGRFNSRS